MGASPIGFDRLTGERASSAIQTGIRLPIDLLVRLRRAAADQHKSLNLYVNDLLESTHPREDW